MLTSDVWLAEQFEFEACAECGWNADRHTVGPDPFGLPHAWCTDPVSDDLPDVDAATELDRRLRISTAV